MEISYGFLRLGRYSYDIVDTIETVGPISDCDKSVVLEIGNTVTETIHLSPESLRIRDHDALKSLYQMDGTVDTLYIKFLRTIISFPTGTKNSNPQEPNVT
jgi:phosphate transport system protein